MSSRSKKEPTPPPPLLLIPAGRGLTFTPPDHLSVLMPVVQSAPPLQPSEVRTEADSFIGQSSSQLDSQRHTSPPLQAYSAQTSGEQYNPFSQTSHSQSYTVPLFASPQNVPGVRAGPSLTSHSSVTPPPATLPFASSTTAASSNIYRLQGGRPQYAAPPTGDQLLAQGASSFATANSQPPTALVSPIISSAVPNIQSTSHAHPHSSYPNTNVGAVQDTSGQFTGGLFYQPVRYHWCYQQNQADIEVWRPFSVLDSTELEMAYSKCLQESSSDTVVLTSGGRYDVNVGQRVRTPVYWNCAPVPVRRCSWFYKREEDNRYIPYDEEFCQQLESEYRKSMEFGGWNRRIEFPGGVVIYMQNANTIVQLPSSVSSNEWSTVQSTQLRSRVVKRGVESFATIQYGEREEVDHLVFVVPGIEDITSSKGRSVEALVDDLRSNALALLNSHFTQAFQSKAVNRVEFLPIVWTEVLEIGAAGLQDHIKDVTLPGTAKLRNFMNGTLADTLFYTSPFFCQKICETVGHEMNRMFHIFLERNQSFSGDVSVIGHGLGSVILFDLLQNQNLPGEAFSNIEDPNLSEEVPLSALIMHSDECSISDHSHAEVDASDEEVTLESLLSKIGLQDHVNFFQQEQIDVDSLVMCSEQDLKEIGLPMGPRKKLLTFLKEEKEKMFNQVTEVKEMTERKAGAELEVTLTHAMSAVVSASGVTTASNGGQFVTARYIQGHAGAGQLKVNYPQLDFTPSTLFALGSPVAVFLSLRGVQDLGEFFHLPTCPRVFNIFHPFDPVAYRLEPLIRPNTTSIKPVQVPHYKGRKRLHLEFKEAVTRYGTDIKQKIMDSFRSTWNTISEFAHTRRAYAKSNTMDDEVQSEVTHMLSHMAQQPPDDDAASISSVAEEEINIGQLNEGQRVDYVLQEGPLESFNDYLFALDSHSVYWESEDTALMLLKEIYSPLGFMPVMPGGTGVKSPERSTLPPKYPPPPVTTAASVQGLLPPSGPFQTKDLYEKSSQFPPATSFHSAQPSLGTFAVSQASAGPPPPMFSPQTQSQMQQGLRKSPYVTPDFASLPSSQSQGLAGPPPMGPALAGGYRMGK